MRSDVARRVFPLVGLLLVAAAIPGVGGCGAPGRTLTITTVPPDAVIKVDGTARGRGRLVHSFRFRSRADSHRVTAEAPGYQDEEQVVALDSPPGDRLVLTMKPRERDVTITVEPYPAFISLNGKALSADAVSEFKTRLQFTLDAQRRWTVHTVTAERKGFATATAEISWTDQAPQVELVLEPQAKDLNIRTNPAGAHVYIDGESYGVTPEAGFTFPKFTFPADENTGEIIPRKVRITKAGYLPHDATIGWDDGKVDYRFDLKAQSKDVRIVTTPRGAAVTIDGREIKRDASGASIARLEFPPVGTGGNFRRYAAEVTRSGPDERFEPARLDIGWDGGRADYAVELAEIKTRDVPLLRWRADRGEGDDAAWRLVPDPVKAVAVKDLVEPGEKAPPFRVLAAPKGASIDTLSVSPDGTQIVYSLVSSPAAGKLAWSMSVVGTDGKSRPPLALDPKAQELTPSFTPDGARIVFSSNRGGGRFSVWSLPVAGGGEATKLTGGDSHDLWPNVDSDPRPRVLIDALLDADARSRRDSARDSGGARVALDVPGATQPRVSPKGDSVIYARADAKTGKRDLYQIPDAGGPPLNLTNSPDVDEFDAVWSADGARSPSPPTARRTRKTKTRNHDIWVLDMKTPSPRARSPPTAAGTTRPAGTRPARPSTSDPTAAASGASGRSTCGDAGRLGARDPEQGTTDDAT